MNRTLVFGLLAIFVLSACEPTSAPTPFPTLTAPPTQISATRTARPPQPTPTQPRLCAGESKPAEVQYTLTAPGARAEILWRASFVPWWVRSSPDGRVLAVTDHGDTIYELKPDGTLAVAFRCPGVVIETFAAASDGALWFAAWQDGRLYRAAPDGTVSILAERGNRNLEAGPDGSVYAMENGLVRIHPDGSTQLITNDTEGRHFAIRPNGEIVALRVPSIVRISETGEITVLATGYGPEPWLTFGPDAQLYVTHWTGVDVINLETGAMHAIPWLENSNIGESGTFAPDGRLLLYHPNTDVFAIDLAAQTVGVYHQVVSNSWAMAVNPHDAVYIAFGNGRANGETAIYRVRDEQALELVASAPYGREGSMVFDAQGMGYLAVGDTALGGAILRFDPASGALEEHQRTQCSPFSLTLHPQTGRVWWEDCTRFASLDENGNRTEIPGVPNGQQASLAITPTGEFYTIAFFRRADQSAPFVHRLYRWDGTAWVEVADLTQSDPGITLSTLVACPDGHIYTVESLDADHLPVNRSSYNAVRRLEADGTLTLIGFDFAFDGLAANCDPATGRIIFTSGAGIFALTPP